jgi:hypothetical protein
MFKKPKTLEEIAEMYSVPTDILEDELKKGIEHEMEHTNDVNVAKTIALHHIAETPNYYEKLEAAKLGEGGMIKIDKFLGNSEYVLEDSVLCFRKLKVGCIMIFDDYGWGGPDLTQRGIDGFLSGFRDRIKNLGLRESQMFLRKLR